MTVLLHTTFQYFVGIDEIVARCLQLTPYSCFRFFAFLQSFYPDEDAAMDQQEDVDGPYDFRSLLKKSNFAPTDSLRRSRQGLNIPVITCSTPSPPPPMPMAGSPYQPSSYCLPQPYQAQNYSSNNYSSSYSSNR